MVFARRVVTQLAEYSSILRDKHCRCVVGSYTRQAGWGQEFHLRHSWNEGEMQRRPAGRTLRVSAVVTVGVAVVALTVGAPGLAGAAPAGAAAPNATSVLNKSVQNKSGASPVNHADALNWVVSYADNGPVGPSSASIIDPVGAGQTYVPGSDTRA